MAQQGRAISIEPNRLRLDLANYRHEKMQTQDEAIVYLLQKEKVLELALDIAAEGINPLDRLGVVELQGSGVQKSYTAVEGNRRVCAMILLNDPERVPAGLPGRSAMVRRLTKAAEGVVLPPKIDCVVFPSKKAAKPWIDRMHLGEAEGISRKRWRADQIERAMGGGRNRDAMSTLDAAEAAGLIDSEERSRKLTTVQRYVGNRVMRHVLGLERDEEGIYRVTKPKGNFTALLTQFIEDVKDGKLSSRSTSSNVIAYATELGSRVGVNDEVCDPYLLTEAFEGSAENGSEQDDSEDEEDSEKNLKIKIRSKIGIDTSLQTAIVKLSNHKLQSLYRSCCDLNLKLHTPLITVGWWSILETLASFHANNEAKFHAYFSKVFIDKFISDKSARNDIWSALQNISTKGNSTKHSATAAHFDGQQLANDVDVITPFLVAVCNEISARNAVVPTP